MMNPDGVTMLVTVRTPDVMNPMKLAPAGGMLKSAPAVKSNAASLSGPHVTSPVIEAHIAPIGPELRMHLEISAAPPVVAPAMNAVVL